MQNVHPWSHNTLRLRQNGRHFPDVIFKYIYLNENVLISVKISLKFVPKDPINNIPALVPIMAWCRLGDKPFPEPMMVSLLMHICTTGSQVVNSILNLKPSGTESEMFPENLDNIDGLAQERRSSIANALELCLPRTNPSIWWLLMPWLLLSPGHEQPLYWLGTNLYILDFPGRQFQQSVVFQCWGMIQNANIFSWLLRKVQHDKS